MTYDNKDDGIVQPGISIKRETWRRFKNTVETGKASSVIEAFMEDYVHSDGDELKRLENELKNKTETLQKIEMKKNEIESDIDRIKTSVERIKKSRAENSKDFEKFMNVFENKYKETDNPDAYQKYDAWTMPSDIADYWKNHLDMSKEKLWKKAINNIEK